MKKHVPNFGQPLPLVFHRILSTTTRAPKLSNDSVFSGERVHRNFITNSPDDFRLAKNRTATQLRKTVRPRLRFSLRDNGPPGF